VCQSPPAFDVVSLASVRVIEEGDIGFHRFTMCYNDSVSARLVDNGWVLDLALRPSACAHLIAGAETGSAGGVLEGTPTPAMTIEKRWARRSDLLRTAQTS
jgi:hypothetical protein